jgi:hypothetical protein
LRVRKRFFFIWGKGSSNADKDHLNSNVVLLFFIIVWMPCFYCYDMTKVKPEGFF